MDMYNKILMKKKRQKQKDKELKSITDERNKGWENRGDQKPAPCNLALSTSGEEPNAPMSFCSLLFIKSQVPASW